MIVKDLMYKDLYDVPGGTTVTEAAKLLADNNIGSFLVKKGKEYIGIVTEGDFVAKVIAEGKDPNVLTVDDVMRYPLIMVDEDADVIDATELMSKYNIKRLLVVDNGEITGVISTRIIAKMLRSLVEERNV